MNKEIGDAARLVNTNIIFVVIVGVVSSRSLYLYMPELFWPGFIFSLLIEVAIFSKFISIVDNSQFSGYKLGLKRNWFNYFLVYIILAASITAASMLANQLQLETLSLIILNNGIKGIIILLTAYILPIVFIKHKHVLSIPLGVAYLVVYKMLIAIAFLTYILKLLNRYCQINNLISSIAAGIGNYKYSNKNKQ